MTTENEAKAQYTFDQVAAHLIQQNERSINNWICAYRGTGGLRCAIGFCISNEDYDPKMEGCVISLAYNSSEIFKIIDKVSHEYCNDVYFLKMLQVIHDCNLPIKWPTTLKQFARRYNLDDSIVDIIVNAKFPMPTLIYELTTI